MAASVEYSILVDPTREGTKVLNNVEDHFDRIGEKGYQAGQRSSQGMDSLYGKLTGLNNPVELAQRAFQLLSLPIEKIISAGSRFEDIHLQLETVLGSASKAQQYFEWIQKFAASTPFKIEGLTESVIMLESFGINGQKYLRTFGDAAAGLKIPLNELSRIMGQIYAKPTAQAEEMLQLIERGIPVQKILQQEMGLTAEQVGNIGKEGIKGKEVFEALARGMEKNYGGAMEKMSKTWTGLISTIGDQITMVLGKIAAPVLESLKEKLSEIIKKIDEWSKNGTLDAWAKRIAGLITGLIDIVTGFVSIIIKIGTVIADVIRICGGLETVATTFAVVFAVTRIQAFITAMSGTSAVFAMLSGSVTGSNILLITHIALTKAAAAAWGLLQKSLPLIAITAAVGVFTKINSLLKELGSQFDEEMAAIIRNNDAMQQTTEKFRSFRDYAKLSSEQLRQMSKDFANVEDRGLRYSLILRAIRDGRYGDEMAKQFQNWRAEQDKLKGSTEGLNQKALEQAKKLKELSEKLGLTTNVNADLEEKTRMLIAAIRAGDPEWEKNAKAVENVRKYIDDLITGYNTAGLQVPESIENIRIALDLANSEQTANKQITKESKETFDLFAKSLDTTVQPLKDYQAQANLTAESQKLAAEMGKLFQVQLEKIGETAQQALGILSQTAGVLETFGIISGDTASQLNSAISNISQGISDITGGFDLITKKGASFLEILSGGLSAIGGVGAIATTIISGLIKLFKGDGVGEAIKRENDWLNLTKEQTDQIRKLAKEYGTVHAATSALLDQFIKDADITLQNFDQYAIRVREILADLDQGKLNSKQTAKELGEAWNAILEDARRLGTEGTKEMLAIISDVRTRGLEVAEIWDYVNQKLNGGLTALGDYLNSLDTSKIQQEITGIQEKLNSSNLTTEEAIKLQNQLFQKQGELVTTTQDIVKNWDFIQGSTLSLFHAYESQGYGFVEIVGMMQNSLQQIGQMALDNGLEVSEGLQAMMNMSNFIAQHEELAKRIQATQTMMKALGDTAFMTQGDFTNFSQQTLSQFDEILKLTGDEELALRLVSPALADLIKYREAYGFTIDSNTEKLIENARQQGMLNEQTMTDQQKIVSLLETITRQLGADIPYEIEALRGKVVQSVDDMYSKTTLWDDSLSGISDRINTIGGDIQNLEDIWTRCTSGNSIIPENLKIVDSLDAIIATIDRTGTSWENLDINHTNLVSNMINTTQGYLDQIMNILNQYALFPDQYNVLSGEFSNLISMMTTDAGMFQGILDQISAQFGITIPNSLYTLASYFSGTMNGMTLSAGDLENILNTLNGQIWDLINLQAQITPIDPSKYGIFDPGEQVDATAKFLALKDLWEKNRETIMKDPDWFRSYLTDLQNLKGGMYGSEAEGAYQKFLQMIQDMYNITPGKEKQKNKNGENEEKPGKTGEGENPDEGDEPDKPYKPPVKKYVPRLNTKTYEKSPSTTSITPSTSTPNVSIDVEAMIKEIMEKAINMRTYNLYFPYGTSYRDQEDFRRIFLEVLGSNTDGFSEKVAVILKEY